MTKASEVLDTLIESLEGLRDPIDKLQELESENDRLRRQLDALEQLRPHWAKGHSEDSLQAAVAQMWDALGAKNQSDAVMRIKLLRRTRPDDNKLLVIDPKSSHASVVSDIVRRTVAETRKALQAEAQAEADDAAAKLVASLIQRISVRQVLSAVTGWDTNDG